MGTVAEMHSECHKSDTESDNQPIVEGYSVIQRAAGAIFLVSSALYQKNAPAGYHAPAARDSQSPTPSGSQLSSAGGLSIGTLAFFCFRQGTLAFRKNAKV